jgi:opacity protein-like surface antigen
VFSAGYRWGNTDAPLDIVFSVEVFTGSGTLTYDPGTGIDATYNYGLGAGTYIGVSFMFDDTLIPD